MDTKCLSCYDVEKNFGKNLQYLKKAGNNPEYLDYHLYKILTKYEEEDIKCFVKLLSLEKHKKILDLYLKRIKTHLIDFEFLNKDLLDLYKRLILINSNIGEVLAFIINNYNLNNSKHIRLVYDFLLDLSKYSRESFTTYWVNLTGYKAEIIYSYIYRHLGCQALYDIIGITQFVNIHKMCNNYVFDFITKDYYEFLIKRIPYRLLKRYGFKYSDFSKIGINWINILSWQIKIPFKNIETHKDILKLKKGE